MLKNKNLFAKNEDLVRINREIEAINQTLIESQKNYENKN